ncbi:unnamed protein product [Rotaria sp. Silwood2]|nr:unnamed protein product [Rotaria sp. Silwood2]CAF2971311.1 unnamed protein product [Rotaria sp. Silwood2]CAF3333948.1 unnamed protein product [Rotaria sp. Silwood2]CAF3392715.1 unnamed protein product [Rotaria sp. Silwood2]CAF4009035.1 unnamed protein product [Rotaria sp. Silwood2]
MATSNAFHRFIQVEWKDRNFLPIDGLETNESPTTITQALQRAGNHTHNVETYVKDAEKRFNGKHLGELTYDECAAVFAYTKEIGGESLYASLNQALCSADRKALKPWLPFVRLFYSAIKKLPDLPTECFRVGKAEMLDQIQREQRITWSGISSCSRAPKLIAKQCRDQKSVLFVITAIHAKDISKYSADSDVKEVLLMPGTRLNVSHITRDEKNNNLMLVYLQELNTEQNEAGISTQMKPGSSYKTEASGEYRLFYS